MEPTTRRVAFYGQKKVTEPRLTCGWAVGEAPPPLAELAVLFYARYGVTFDAVRGGPRINGHQLPSRGRGP